LVTLEGLKNKIKVKYLRFFEKKLGEMPGQGKDNMNMTSLGGDYGFGNN
jgi:hypothetical protein